jgi:hypothetical protein
LPASGHGNRAMAEALFLSEAVRRGLLELT